MIIIAASILGLAIEHGLSDIADAIREKNREP